jgi:hypothetical protein
MNFADPLKRLIGRKPQRTPIPGANEPTTWGFRQDESENPYLAARRTWNEHVGGVVSSRQTWQVIGILSLLIALAGVGGIIHIGSQSKFVPYVVQVDRLGQAVAVAPADRAAPADARVIEASVASFIATRAWSRRTWPCSARPCSACTRCSHRTTRPRPG